MENEQCGGNGASEKPCTCVPWKRITHLLLHILHVPISGGDALTPVERKNDHDIVSFANSHQSP